MTGPALQRYLTARRRLVERALVEPLPAARAAFSGARSATACWAAASACAPSSRSPPARWRARRSRRVAALRLRARADPHLFAGARRPAGHGRRRPAPRAPDQPQGLRRGHGHPGGRRAAHRGVRHDGGRARRRAVAAPWRPSPSWRAPPARLAWSAARRSTSRPRAVARRLAQVRDIHRRKTGALFTAAVRVGGLVGGASAPTLRRPHRRTASSSGCASRSPTTSPTPRRRATGGPIGRSARRRTRRCSASRARGGTRSGRAMRRSMR